MEKTIICFQGAQTHKMKIKLKKPVIVTLVQFALTIRALKGEGGEDAADAEILVAGRTRKRPRQMGKQTKEICSSASQ